MHAKPREARRRAISSATFCLAMALVAILAWLVLAPPQQPSRPSRQTGSGIEQTNHTEGSGPTDAVSLTTFATGTDALPLVPPDASWPAARIPLGSIRGRIISSTGGPLDGAEVSAWRQASLPGVVIPAGLASTATSGPEGRFELIGVSPLVSHSVTARLDSRTAVGRADLRVPPADALDIGDIVLLEPGRIEGIVLADGIAIGGAVATYQGTHAGDPSAPSLQSVADTNGRFSLESVPAGTGSLHVSAPRYASLNLGGLLVEAGVTLQVTADLRPEAFIGGRIVAESGQALPGATVLAVSEGAGVEWPLASTGSVDETNGAFLIQGLASGTYRIKARAPGYAPASVFHVPTGLIDVHIVLAPLGRLELRVVDGGGRPVADCQAWIRRSTAMVASDPLEALANWHPLPADPKQQAGLVIAPSLVAGHYVVVASGPGHGPSAPIPVTIRDRLITSATAMTSAARALTGRVIESGTTTPVRAAHVAIRQEDILPCGWCFSGDDGTFLLDGVPSSPAVLVVSASGFLTREIPVPGSLATAPVIDLVRAGAVRVVLGPHLRGTAADFWDVLLVHEDGQESRMAADVEDQCVFDGLPAGRWTIVVEREESGDPDVSLEAIVAVRPGELAVIEFDEPLLDEP